MDKIDRKLIAETEKGIPITPQPFEEIAKDLGITPQEVIIRLQELKKSGVIRRFGVSVKPDSVGYSANALVAWKVPKERIAKVSQYFCKCKEISHCYERETVFGKWEYNFYTVMHAQERSMVQEMVRHFAAETSLSEYAILFSTRNLKLKEITKC
ncbi:MAG TPA: AsnC family transcriptional regulator [Candidatus Acidoferrales bacterium]|nr:AsnC family transcriptional regulator [Candidatus Acidoferrales bacterium]